MFTKFFAILLVSIFAASTWGMDGKNEEGLWGVSIIIPASEDQTVDYESRDMKEDIADECQGGMRKNVRSNLIRDLSALNYASNHFSTPSLQRESSGSLGCAIPGFSEPYDSVKNEGEPLLNERVVLSERRAFLKTINKLLGEQKISGSPVFHSISEQSGLYQLVFTLKHS